jgi:outer membrane receptor protein involved in Fe transport
MRFSRSWLLSAVALFAFAVVAAAQTTNGTISGHVADQQGLALPGVTVSASSPNLQGVRSEVSTENGDFVLAGLPSGSYTITFELSGFQTVTQNVTLAPTQALPVNAQMNAGGFAESVNVVGTKTETLMKTSQVATNFSQELIQTLPTTRDINASMLQAPGVKATGPNGAYSIAGAASFETLYMVNGVSIMDNLRGTPFDLYVEDAIQETTVAVAGVSAEFGRFGGGVVNVVTKSGGNIFSGSFRDTLNNDKWRTLTPFEDTAIANDPAHRELRIAKVVPDYSYTFSGPVVKDQLWFFNAGRFQSQESGRTLLATNIPYTLTDSSQRYEGKLTYSATARHRFQGDYIKIAQTQSNFSNNAAAMDVRSLGERKVPQSLFTLNYNGVLSNKLFVEGRFSSRKFAFENAGAKSTDLIEGTLLIDQSRSGRYWSDTFCGVCGPEERNNRDFFVKGSYFMSRKGSGSHNLTVGYDNFSDLRSANNHQSGSDYRILGTSAFLLPNGEVVPQFLGNDTTFIQYNPLPLLSQGADFQTHSAFVQDAWRVNDHVSANLGLRWDKNHGVDQSGAVTANDSGWSPRIGIVWDPNGKGQWAVSGSFAKYTAAISNPIADSGSAAGNPQSYIWFYRGANINATGPVTTTPDAIRQVFAWLNANGGTSRQTGFVQPPTIPGLTPRIDGSLESPYNLEYSGGVSRQFGAKASLRADVSYRDFHNAYVNRIDQSTGKVTNSFGQSFDLALIQNDSDGLLKRQYAGLILSGSYQFTSRVYAGGNYTLSHAWGNFDGENLNSGPVASSAYQFPEYKQAAWNYPVGDLQIDQRHRARLWYVHGMPKIEGLTLSLLQTLESGVPYSASNINNASANGVNPRPFVTLPPGVSYVNPPTGASTTYFFTARDGFRTEGQMRTDLAVNYNYRVKGSRMELFGQLSVLNLFDNFQLCGCGGTVFQNGGAVSQTRIDTTVRTNVTNPTLYAAFNPFTTTPVEGVNWAKGPVFGTALNRFAYTSPRELRLSFGVRF